ncbi:adenine phosphoribosyltransferase [Starmerella bacillaris]|uniref:adenine phosphoribosyltransferase n=1 Tax=Starmerella bacillaris TaxID=1247836 RepID=A0AAV5RIY8_STABA|nr:adenine phosphoribosyltransferase [Starmerella bacillaris]
MVDLTEVQKELKKVIAVYPDFPKKGILFEDILPIFQNPDVFRIMIDALKDHVKPLAPTVIVGLDARGFLFGPTLALELGVSFVPVRKEGKLAGEVYRAVYQKEYGEDVFCLQKSAINKGDKVVIVDDIIATGGSAAAAGQLVTEAGGIVSEYVFLMELLFLNGREKLNAPVFTLMGGQE